MMVEPTKTESKETLDESQRSLWDYKKIQKLYTMLLLQQRSEDG